MTNFKEDLLILVGISVEVLRVGQDVLVQVLVELRQNARNLPILLGAALQVIELASGVSRLVGRMSTLAG